MSPYVRAPLALTACLVGGLVAFGCSSSSSGGGGALPPGPGGTGTNNNSTAIGSTFSPSTGTRMVFVSSSQGNDANPGTETQPVATLAAGVALLRDGQPDWLLLKKGDAWNESFGQWRLSGQSANAPMVIWAYGSGARPLVRTGAQPAFQTLGSSNGPAQNNFLVWSGIHFQAHTRVPGSPTFTGTSGSAGVNWLRGSTNLLIDDCVFDHYGLGMNFDDIDGLGLGGITIRRCLILDSYNVSPTHSQGLYASRVNGLTIEDCIFDHNGWNETLSGGTQATAFNHNIYIQSDSANVTVRRNIIVRGASHGVQLRPGGTIQDNIFVQNSIAALLGTSNSVPGGINGSVTGNVIVEGKNIGSADPRGWGIDLVQITGATVSNNIIANVLPEALNAGNTVSIVNSANTTYTGNIVFNWPGDAMFATPGPFVNDAVSVAAYNGTQGGPVTFQGFIDSIRAQSRDSYNTAFTAASIKTYFQQGFTPN